jgi:hypothetical protein
MLSRSALVARKVLPRTLVGGSTSAAARSMSDAAAAATSEATSVTLNLTVPYESIYKGTPVESVIIPGTEGEYGITVNHVPYVSQMKPGVLQVLFEGSEPEKYFVAGGYAVTHANSVTVSFFCNGRASLRALHFAAGVCLTNKVFSFCPHPHPTLGRRLCGGRQVG